LSSARWVAFLGLMVGTAACTIETVNDFRNAYGMPSLPQVRICREKPSGYDQRTVIEACTTQIEHGGLSGADLGIAYLNRGVAHMELDEYPASRSDLDRAVEILSEATDGARNLQLALYNRAFLHAMVGNRDDALADFDRSRPAFSHWEKSRFHAILGDYPRANEEFERAARADGPRFVNSVQQYLRRKGLFSGEVDGRLSPGLVVAYESCARDVDCLMNR